VSPIHVRRCPCLIDFNCSYSFPFPRGRSSKPTTLAITNINLPDNVQSFNTGSSLAKWSNKRVRLKSAKIPKTPTEFDKDFCYETLETELSLILNEPEERHTPDSLTNLQYEVHTDIEKLLQESERCPEDDKDKPKRRRKKRRNAKKKTIKFSKSPSPQTEQVIRVDVTSNVSAEEERRGGASDDDNCGGGEVIDDKRKELKRNLNESGAEMCDEDFIVRCRQLALRQRRRRV
jgi:hypothetical protein